MVDAAMRTTLVIDDDVLIAARAIARQTNRTIGEVVSELARRSLVPPSAGASRNGVAQLPPRLPGVIVTPDLIDELRDELP
jgi:hypothetical protein